MKSAFPSQSRFAPREPGSRDIGTIRPDFPLNQLQVQQRAVPTSHYIGLCRSNWAVEMAIYSLTGNARSPFHAEPAQRDERLLRSKIPFLSFGTAWGDAIKGSDSRA